MPEIGKNSVASRAVTVQRVPAIKQSYTAIILWILEETTKKYALSARGKINKMRQKWELRGYWEKVLQRNWFQGRKGFRRGGQAAREGQGWNNPGMGRARNRAGNCSEKRPKSYKKFFCKQRSVMWFLLHEINEQKDTSCIFISLADIDSCFRGKRSLPIHIHSF